jgi:hypothetical protein
MSDLPTDSAAKRAMLRRGAEIGQQIAALAHIGDLADPLGEYLAAQPDLTIAPTSAGLTAVFAGHVRWQISITTDGRIAGVGSSGFGPLMAALGIDFSGSPYSEGDGQ